MIPVTFSNLLTFRREISSPLFGEAFSDSLYKIFIPYKGVILTCMIVTDSTEHNSIKNYINKPLPMYDNRVISHDFGNSASWTSTNDSTYDVIPLPGYIFHVFSVIIRFPENVYISPTNRIMYKVFKSFDGVTPVAENSPPIITLIYPSVVELIKKANNPIGLVNLAGSQSIIEVSFLYASPYDLSGAVLTLRSSLNECIKMYMENHTPLTDIDSVSLTGECYAAFNIRRTHDL